MAHTPDLTLALSPDVLIPAIRKSYDLPLIEGVLYRYLVIPQMKQALLKQKAQLAWMDLAPDWGRGRQDPFNPAKTQILKLPYDGSVGASDVPALWNWERRDGFALHWDGLNTSLTEILLNSAIGNWASNKTIDLRGVERIENWIKSATPAPYPFPVEKSLAERGAAVFSGACAYCHAFTSKQVGHPIRHDQVRTDPERLATWSSAVADEFNALEIYAWKYSHFRPSFGYVAAPLDGIWARAPYLHNGSVPTLHDLLTRPEARPRLFYRGYTLYDPVHVGFVSQGGQAAAVGSPYDVGQRGNSNQGHEYGTGLAEGDKAALLEYLKTL